MKKRSKKKPSDCWCRFCMLLPTFLTVYIHVGRTRASQTREKTNFAKPTQSQNWFSLRRAPGEIKCASEQRTQHMWKWSSFFFIHFTSAICIATHSFIKYSSQQKHRHETICLLMNENTKKCVFAIKREYERCAPRFRAKNMHCTCIKLLYCVVVTSSIALLSSAPKRNKHYDPAECQLLRGRPDFFLSPLIRFRLAVWGNAI